MTISWMLYVLLVGTLLAACAVAVASALTLARRATRWVWATTLVAIAVFAVVVPRASTITMVQTHERAVRSVPTDAIATPESGVWSAIRSVRVLVASATVRTIAVLGARVPGALRTPVVFGWLATSGVLLAIYLFVHLRLARARRRWPVQRLQGLSVRVAPTAGPAVIGMLRAEIVVPRSLLERSTDEQRLIIDHEHEHLRSGDHLLLALGCLAAIVLPWHPAVWYVLARLRLAIELDCDARVLRRGAAPRSYGALLIDMAAHGAGIRVGALALSDRPSHLERRLLAMRATRSRFMLLRVGALCAAATLLVLAACEAKVPTAADIASMDVSTAEKSAAEAGIMRTPSDDRADFFVNGVKVTAEQARVMEAKSIGSIEVVKSELPSGRDTIFVTTADRMPKDRELATALRASTLKGETEQTFMIRKQKPTVDPAEHLVAHVEGELAAVRADERGASASDSKPRMMLRTPGVGGGDPLFLVDGKKIPSAAFGSLRGEDIAEIAVFKGETALKMSSDPAAKNGVVVVRTKSAKKN
ncbi:MAG: M56 family metallopeptidase [bacterium]